MNPSEEIIQVLMKNSQTIKKKLPLLFRIAEIESSRAGRVGMEVGNIREKIIIAMFYYFFGSKKVNAEIPTTASQVDVIVIDQPISIKTITSKTKRKEIAGIKISWTVDWKKVTDFITTYKIETDMLLIQINWGGVGGLYYIPQKIQEEVLDEMKTNYFKKPKKGTNPRGIEISKKAIYKMINNPKSLTINISWNIPTIGYSPYTRWINLWEDKNV